MIASDLASPRPPAAAPRPRARRHRAGRRRGAAAALRRQRADRRHVGRRQDDHRLRPAGAAGRRAGTSSASSTPRATTATSRARSASATPTHTPSHDEVMALLGHRAERRRQPARHQAGGPAAASSLACSRASRRCARATGRPHWVLIDEAHHLLPTRVAADGGACPSRSGAAASSSSPCIRTRSRRARWRAVDVALAIGREPDKTLAMLADATGRAAACRLRRAAAPRARRWPGGARETGTRRASCAPSRRRPSSAATSASTPRAS